MWPEIENHQAILQEVARILAESSSVSEIKESRDRAEALRKYAKAARLGLEWRNEAAKAKLRAERKLGEMLAGLTLNGGDRRSKFHAARVKLADLSIEPTQSHRWQQMASVPEAQFEEYLRETEAAGHEITAAGVSRLDNRRRKRMPIVLSRRFRKPSSVPRSARDAELLSEAWNHSELLLRLLEPACMNEAFMLQRPERRLVVRLLREICEFLRALNADENQPTAACPGSRRQ
jgi:hypothetical protein